MNTPHPIAAALRFTAECIIDGVAVGMFIGAALLWAGVIGGPL